MAVVDRGVGDERVEMGIRQRHRHGEFVTFTGSAPGSATIQFEKSVGGLVDPSLDETGVDDQGPSSFSASESLLESLLKSLLESKVIVSPRMTSYTACSCTPRRVESFSAAGRPSPGTSLYRRL